uniref:Uncharacterized protein n=1 Tax=Octopus bimaculoides TaxID=37653 RepID=A0A0L8HDC1_OCTBM
MSVLFVDSWRVPPPTADAKLLFCFSSVCMFFTFMFLLVTVQFDSSGNSSSEESETSPNNKFSIFFPPVDSSSPDEDTLFGILPAITVSLIGETHDSFQTKTITQ